MMKDTKMSQASKREVVERLRPRYLHASRAEKTKIPDEFVALSGMHRKSAIRLLGHGYQGGRERRGRKRLYTGAVVAALADIWHICGCICGKRLQLFLGEMARVLERHGELVLDEETRALLLQISAATIDRKLQPFRQQQGRGLSTTKPGTLLKQSIPVRTFAEWDEGQPGCVDQPDSIWFEGSYGFILKDARPLPFVPWRGQRKIFDVPEGVFGEELGT
jgi:hypothetical protein